MIEIKLRADASQAIYTLERMSHDLLLESINRALTIAMINRYTVIRVVIGHKMAERLREYNPDVGARGGGPIKAVYGYPVEIDEETPLGFGLVTRPPTT